MPVAKHERLYGLGYVIGKWSCTTLKALVANQRTTQKPRHLGLRLVQAVSMLGKSGVVHEK